MVTPRSLVRVGAYTQRTVADGPALPYQHVDARSPLGALADGMSDVAAGIGDLAEGRMQIEALQTAQREDHARVTVMRELAQARAAFNAELERARAEAEDGAVGLTHGLEAWLESWRADAAERMSTPEAAREFDASWAPFQIDALELGARAEREEGRAYTLDLARQSIEANVATLVADPGAFAVVLERDSAAIGGLRNITPDERRDLTEALQSDAANAAALGLVRRNPGQMLALLQRPPAAGEEADPRNPLTYLDARARLSLIAQAQAEIDRREARARAALMDEMQLQSRDLERGVPVPEPVSVERVRAVFGERRARAWALELAASEQWSGLANQTSTQLAQILAAPRPGGDADRDAIMTHEARQLAAARILERRQDPQAFLIQQGVSDDANAAAAFQGALDAPAELANAAWGEFFSVLRRRAGAAAEGAQRYGLAAALPLTAEEAAYIGHTLNGLPSQHRAAFFQRAHAALAGPRGAIAARGRAGDRDQSAYRALASQLMGASPTTAFAGYIYGLSSETMNPEAEARLILRGEDILRGAGDGRASPVNMPSEDDLRLRWARLVGDAYVRIPQAGEDAYNVFRAHYAATTELSGPVTSNAVDRDRARAAAAAATGGVVVWNDTETLTPWGMSAATFAARVEQAWPALQAAHGELLGDAEPDDFALAATREPGVYALIWNGVLVRVPDGDGAEGEILLRIRPD